ncbi:MAG: UDP-N-acetylmuramate--L-alanine ligase [Deltaproteobacteria bacterium]|nr:UDP-N-acetylmuramate--L-alanine ligase [Deltaproteobacteria bacterium]
MYRGRIKKIHFVGIGGSGMNGIAEVLLNMGYKVSGSDLKANDVTRRLASLGAAIYEGHKKENLNDADCVVYSSAVKMDNPEIIEARRRQIPIIPRAEMLAELMRMKYGIAVAGTHGKTTTTSMIASVLARAGFDPTVVTGGKLNSIGSNAVLGGGDFLVAEADESDGSFLKLSPTIAVATNIDREHMDHYRDMEEVKKAFLDFINKVPFYGCGVVCLDHPVIRELLPSIARRHITYGLSAQADVRASAISQNGVRTSFDVALAGTSPGRLTINLPGRHNVLNALAAYAVGRELEIGVEAIREGLEEFKGVERRFQIKGSAGGIMVVDDYGHHPVEIQAVLRSIKDGWEKRVITVFQPHRYSRTADLFMEFIPAFNDADAVILTDVYAAGEERIAGADSRKLSLAIGEHGHKDVSYIPVLSDIPAHLEKILKPGDVVLTLGAGDVWKVADEIAARLRELYPEGDVFKLAGHDGRPFAAGRKRE